ncbi:hypothetical protein VNI00_014143 [Paramarasmius palmivorus]|uniref:F-box domain-containing protein n=1 Tax=Paramarasmius palmivorus TaxID=297713 RepID=A0AAW0BVR8_9AGAR
MPHIPVELAERIVDYLQDDKLSLLTTSLISRSWTPRSRQHYFADLHLPRLHRPVEEFKDLCAHPLSTISTTRTRKLTLRRPLSLKLWKASFLWLLSPAFESAKSMTVIEALFHSIDEIEIIGAKDLDEWAPLRELIQSGHLQKIRRLTMTRCTRNAAGLRYLLNAFDMLEVLTLDEVYIDKYHIMELGEYSLPETLNRLVIRDQFGLIGFSTQLDLKNSTCLGLREIYIDIGSSFSVIEDLKNFLRRSSVSTRHRRRCTLGVRGVSVKIDALRRLVAETEWTGWELALKGELYMICGIFAAGSPHDRAGSFSSNSNLKYILVEDILGLMNSSRCFQRDFAYFEELLEMDPIFHCVEEILLEVALELSEVELADAGWDERELMVVRGSYPHILMEIVVEAIQDLLPYCHDGGMLRVQELFRKREKR